MTQSVVKETILTETMSCSRHTLDEKTVKNGGKMSAGVKRSLRVSHEARAGRDKRQAVHVNAGAPCCSSTNLLGTELHGIV